MRREFQIHVGNKESGERFWGDSLSPANEYLGGVLKKHGVGSGMDIEYDNIAGVIGRTRVQTDKGFFEVLYKKNSGIIEVNELRENHEYNMPYINHRKSLPIERVKRVCGDVRTAYLLYGALAIALDECDFESGIFIRDVDTNKCGYGRVHGGILKLNKKNPARIDTLSVEKAWYNDIKIRDVLFEESEHLGDARIYNIASANISADKVIATTHIVDEAAYNDGEITRKTLAMNHIDFFNETNVVPAQISSHGFYPITHFKVGDLNSLVSEYWRSRDGCSAVLFENNVQRMDRRKIYGFQLLDLESLELN